jgi:hypothetical protein
VLFAFSDAVDKKAKKHPLIVIICSELLMFYYAFFAWKKQPRANENTFTLYKKSSLIAIQLMVIHAIVFETVGIHWWLHEKSLLLSILLFVLNLYSIILLIGDIHAVRLNPIQVENDRIYVSLGLMKRMEIPMNEIETVIEEKEILEQKPTKETIEFIARDFEKVSPDVLLKLKHPVQATLLLGKKQSYKQVAIKVDEPEKFLALIKQNLTKETY